MKRNPRAVRFEDLVKACNRSLVQRVVTGLERSREAVQEPISTRSYSGKFMVRVSPEVHRTLAIQAAESGVSLNRLIPANSRDGAV
jgi:predicted HicB family RNase H-like nuclease